MQGEIKIYEVGGSIRDSILGLHCKDRDFCVLAPSYEAMRQHILERGGKIYLERPQYFAIRCQMEEYGDADFTLARKEGFYSDGRRPDTVEMCETIEEELARRDFTIGAMARGEDGVILDPFNGQEDLGNKILRCVGDARERLREDYLRILRAARFSITKGFNIHEDIHFCLKNPEIVAGLEGISKERIYEEVRKCLDHDTAATIHFFVKYPLLASTIIEKCGIKLSARM